MEEKLYSKSEAELIINQKTSELCKLVEEYKIKESEWEAQTASVADANVLADELVVEIEDKNDELEGLNGQLEEKRVEIENAYGQLENTFDDLKKEQAFKEIDLRRMEIELQTAQTVQALLLPEQEDLNVPGLEVSSGYHAASETGGDWIGFIVNSFKDKVNLLIGDVTGHGIGSALMTAGTYAFYSTVKELSESCLNTQDAKYGTDDPTLLALQSFKGHLYQPENMMHLLNRVICDMGKRSMYMTFFNTTIDLRAETILSSNAGHCTPIIIRKDGEVFSSNLSLYTKGARLGNDPTKSEFFSKKTELQNEDLILLYTDGLVENTNKSGAVIKKRDIIKFLKQNHNYSAKELKRRFSDMVFNFLGDDKNLEDDIAYILAKFDKSG